MRSPLGRSGVDAASIIAFAQANVGKDWPQGWCQRFVRTAMGSNGGAEDALDAWQAARSKHGDDNPPAGAPVYWAGGHGHVAISAGNGMVYTTDLPEVGKVGLVSIDYISQHWGKTYLGWSDDNNGIRINKYNAKPVDPDTVARQYQPTGVGAAGGGVATDYSHRMLASDYGYVSKFFDSDPSLKRLVARAVKQQWTTDVFAARLKDTKWYRQHTDAEKSWLQKTIEDPAQAKDEQANRRAQILALAKQQGVLLPPKRLAAMVNDSLRFDWQDDKLQDAVAAEYHYKAGVAATGVAGETLDDLRAQAKAYLVPLSDGTLESWTRQVLAGDQTTDGFTDYLKTQAKSLFPALTGAIDSGTTVDQYFDPYRQQAAQILGVNANDIDFNDDKWKSIVYGVDPATGQRGVKSLDDAAQIVRTDSRFGFDKSSNARSTAAQLATALGQKLGAIG